MFTKMRNSLRLSVFIMLLMVILLVGIRPNSVTATPSAPQDFWTATITFDEAEFDNVLGTSLTTLPNGFTATFDILNVTGSGECDAVPINLYEEGQDGTDDLRLTVTVVNGSGSRWNAEEARWSPAGIADFRSSWRINSSNVSRPNDYGYMKFNFEFLNLGPSIAAEETSITVQGANGSSEAYEWTFVTVNGAAIPVANIANYRNTTYSDLAGSSNFNASGTWLNAPQALTNGDPAPAASDRFPHNQTMSEFLSGSNNSGGLVSAGWWAIDDFNTDIYDAPEQESFNPDGGNGLINDNQTIDGLDFGLAPLATIDQFAVYFGLVDVGFDTNTNGTTQTNSLPSAAFSEFTIGFNTGTQCSTAVTLESFAATTNADNTVTLDWETALEVDNAGFNILRREAGSRAEWGQVNNELIAAQGTQAQGATYQFQDSAVTIGSWEYVLEDIDTSGVTRRHLDFIASAEVRTPTAVNLTNTATSSVTVIGFSLLSTLLISALLLHSVAASRKKTRTTNQS